MDKLHWFKFIPSDWMMGKIQRCSEITQARFVRLCCIYWNKQANMSIDDVICEIDQECYDELIQRKIISSDDEHVFIDFLDEQFEHVQEMSRKASKAGKISAQKRKERKEQEFNDRSTTVQRNSTDKIRTEKKRKENKKTKEKKRELIYPFDSPDFLNFWETWKKYKKDEHKFQYKSALSEQAALKKLSELAQMDEQVAISIIEQSIANGYKGLFELKNQQNGKIGITNKKRGATADEIANAAFKVFGKNS